MLHVIKIQHSERYLKSKLQEPEYDKSSQSFILLCKNCTTTDLVTLHPPPPHSPQSVAPSRDTFLALPLDLRPLPICIFMVREPTAPASRSMRAIMRRRGRPPLEFNIPPSKALLGDFFLHTFLVRSPPLAAGSRFFCRGGQVGRA